MQKRFYRLTRPPPCALIDDRLAMLTHPLESRFTIQPHSSDQKVTECSLPDALRTWRTYCGRPVICSFRMLRFMFTLICYLPQLHAVILLAGSNALRESPSYIEDITAISVFSHYSALSDVSDMAVMSARPYTHQFRFDTHCNHTTQSGSRLSTSLHDIM